MICMYVCMYIQNCIISINISKVLSCFSLYFVRSSVEHFYFCILFFLLSFKCENVYKITTRLAAQNERCITFLYSSDIECGSVTAPHHIFLLCVEITNYNDINYNSSNPESNQKQLASAIWC